MSNDTLDTTLDVEPASDEVEGENSGPDGTEPDLQQVVEELRRKVAHLEGVKNQSFKERDKYKALLAKRSKGAPSKDEELDTLKQNMATILIRDQFNDALAMTDVQLTSKQKAYLREQAIKTAPDNMTDWLAHTVDVLGLSAPAAVPAKAPEAAKGRLPAQPSPSVEPSTNLPADPRLIEKNLWRSMTTEQRQERMNNWKRTNGSNVTAFIEGMRKRRNG